MQNPYIRILCDTQTFNYEHVGSAPGTGSHISTGQDLGICMEKPSNEYPKIYPHYLLVKRLYIETLD